MPEQRKSCVKHQGLCIEDINDTQFPVSIDDDGDLYIEYNDNMYLTRDMAREVGELLIRFAETGKLTIESK